jgi:beta-galactosidase
MKPFRLIFLSVALLAATRVPAESPRVVQAFDAAWMFYPGDAPAAGDPMFDDATWRTLDVPHDWAIEGVPEANQPAGRGGGYRPSGVSWYRKRFTLPAALAGRHVVVEFDGVMANSRVWINGQPVCGRPSGYVGFACDLTGRIEFGEDKSNVIAVRTDTTLQPASRWYTGQGIYRHVRLVVTGPVRIPRSGMFVATPEIDPAHAIVRVQVAVENLADSPRKLSAHVTLVDPAGVVVATADAPAREVGIGEQAVFTAESSLAHPQLWDVAHGVLYRAEAEIRDGDRAVDGTGVTFGLRAARFDAATGFWLNGRNVRLLGVCLHADGGATGVAVPLSLWAERLHRLRALGVNAIRTAHNPPAPGFLDLCDRLGFLVMDELFDAWTVGKEHAEKGVNLDFTDWSDRDTRDTIRRDRNHPSVILYSTGNEIHDTPNAMLAKNILAGLIGAIRAEDPTRPITQALFRPNVSHDYTDGLADMLDVIGQNYREDELIAAHRQKPGRRVLGTENTHDPRVWVAMRDHPFIAGQFLWTGVDYLGEADWPYVLAPSGLLDTTGAYHERAWQRASFWTAAPMVHLVRVESALDGADPRRRNGFNRVSDWTPKDPAAPATVEVYSNCAEVELLLNGRSLGTLPKPVDDQPRVWPTPFEAGVIKAVAREGGQIVATHELQTAGPPVRLQIETSRPQLAPDWDDVAVVTVTAVDAKGVAFPWAEDEVTFQCDGPGAIAAVDNGDPQSHEPFQSTRRRLFRGHCIAIVRATAASGSLTISASAPGLASGKVSIAAGPVGAFLP